MDSQPGQNAQIPKAAGQQISAKLFSAKYNSKREVYNFLAVDVGVYLPHFDQVTIYFLKDLANGKKKRKWIWLNLNQHVLDIVIKNKDVRHI